MKRKTVNQIGQPLPLRALKKNKSCQLHQRFFSRTSNPTIHNQHSFAHASSIVVHLIEDLFQCLDIHFRASDERAFLARLTDTATATTTFLLNMVSPIANEEHTASNSVKCETQPQSSTNDALCGSSQQLNEKKVKKVGRVSIAMREEPGRPLQSKQGSSTKFIKMCKEDVGARREGVVALCGDQEGRDTMEEMLREKLLKEKRSAFLSHPLGEGQSRPVALPSIEEYSFDYDGSIFPLKKISTLNSLRIKVLNTTCKLAAKQALLSRPHNLHLKTEEGEGDGQKENGRALERRALSLKRQSSLLPELSCSQSRVRSKIQECVWTGGVRMRELKG